MRSLSAHSAAGRTDLWQLDAFRAPSAVAGGGPASARVTARRRSALSPCGRHFIGRTGCCGRGRDCRCRRSDRPTAGAMPPQDRNYNRPVQHPYPASAEHMWRPDGLYDLVVVMGYNDRPRITGRGSAVFMHVAGAGAKADRGMHRAGAAAPAPAAAGRLAAHSSSKCTADAAYRAKKTARNAEAPGRVWSTPRGRRTLGRRSRAADRITGPRPAVVTTERTRRAARRRGLRPRRTSLTRMPIVNFKTIRITKVARPLHDDGGEHAVHLDRNLGEVALEQTGLAANKLRLRTRPSGWRR